MCSWKPFLVSAAALLVVAGILVAARGHLVTGYVMRFTDTPRVICETAVALGEWSAEDPLAFAKRFPREQVSYSAIGPEVPRIRKLATDWWGHPLCMRYVPT